MNRWINQLAQDQTLHPESKQLLLNLLESIQREYEAALDDPATKDMDDVEWKVRGALCKLQYSHDSRPSVKVYVQRYQEAVDAWSAYYNVLRNQRRVEAREAASARESQEEVEAEAEAQTEEEEPVARPVAWNPGWFENPEDAEALAPKEYMEEDEDTPDSLQGGGKIGQWLKKLFTKKVPPKQPELKPWDKAEAWFADESRRREKMLEQISQGKLSGGGVSKDLLAKWSKTKLLANDKYAGYREQLKKEKEQREKLAKLVVKPIYEATEQPAEQQEKEQPQPLVKPAKLPGAYVNTGVVDAKKRINELLKKVQKPTEN